MVREGSCKGLGVWFSVADSCGCAKATEELKPYDESRLQRFQQKEVSIWTECFYRILRSKSRYAQII
jgi:hypothetical protein